MFRTLERDFVLVCIKADKKLRFERISKRGTVKDIASIDAFEEQEKREALLYDLYDKFEESADFSASNNGMVVELYAIAEEVLKKFDLIPKL